MEENIKLFLEYLQTQNRAVTIDEVVKHTSINDTLDNVHQINDALPALEENGLISMDYTIIDKETLNSSTRIYPTDKLLSKEVKSIQLR